MSVCDLMTLNYGDCMHDVTNITLIGRNYAIEQNTTKMIFAKIKGIHYGHKIKLLNEIVKVNKKNEVTKVSLSPLSNCLDFVGVAWNA